MFTKRSDMERIYWLHEVKPFKWKRHTLRYNRSNWDNIPKQEFRSFIVRIAIKERRSWPGAVRSHWRHKRTEAVKYFETKWGAVPEVMHGRHIPPNSIMFKSKGWAQWARS